MKSAKPRIAAGAFAHSDTQAAVSVAAASSLAFLHAAALSWLISVLVPTFIVAGPQPSRFILKNRSSEMPCKAQNAWIESASAFGSTLGGFRLYFGPSESGGPRLCPSFARPPAPVVFLPPTSRPALALAPSQLPPSPSP